MTEVALSLFVLANFNMGASFYMNVIPFPNHKYSIIYAGPPWSYNDKTDRIVCQGTTEELGGLGK